MVLHARRVIIAAALVLLPVVAAAAIAPGTQVTGNIDKSYSSANAQVGEAFTLSDVHSSDHDINGAVVYGHVAKVQRAGQGTPGKIELDFDKVNTRSGNVYKIVGHATNVQVNTKKNTGKEVASTAGGALVGGLIGGGVGAAIGGSGGLLYSKNSKQNVDIPKGSLVTVKIASASAATR